MKSKFASFKFRKDFVSDRSVASKWWFDSTVLLQFWYYDLFVYYRYANRAKNIKNKPKINEDPKVYPPPLECEEPSEYDQIKFDCLRGCLVAFDWWSFSRDFRKTRFMSKQSRKGIWITPPARQHESICILNISNSWWRAACVQDAMLREFQDEISRLKAQLEQVYAKKIFL